jgi:hypothetical protein
MCSGSFASPKQDLEAGASSETPTRYYRDVELEVIRQQEHPIDGWIADEVKQMNRVESRHEVAGSVVEDFRHFDDVGDAEGQIEIRPAIPSAESEGADLGLRDNACVAAREFQHVFAHPIAFLDGKHRPIICTVSPSIFQILWLESVCRLMSGMRSSHSRPSFSGAP